MARISDPSAPQRQAPRAGGGVPNVGGEPASLGPDRGLQILGADIQQGTEEIYRAQKVEEDRINTLRAEEAYTKLREQQLNLTIGEQDGFTNLKAADAVSRPILTEWSKRFDDAERDIAAGLNNDQQRERFKQRAGVARLQYQENILHHGATQNDVYSRQQLATTIDTELRSAASNPTDTMAVGLSWTRINSAIELEGKRRGMDKAAVDVEKAKARDQMWVKRIDALLYEQPLVADALFRANEKEISSPEVRLNLQARTREVAMGITATMEAQSVVDEVRSRVPPAGGAEQVPVSGGMPNAGLARSVRNNNPGNIEKGETKWAGEVAGDDSRFVTFATPEDGQRAMEKNLLTYQDKHGLNTVESIIGRWAPAKENGEQATSNYIKTVSAALGVKKGDELNLRNPTVMRALTTAMAMVEAGGGSMQRVGSEEPAAPAQANTSGMPSSRDVAAQLPFMMLRVEKRATALYGADEANPDRVAFVQRMTREIHSKVAADVQQLNALQRQAQGVLIDAVTGVSGAGAQQGLMQAGGGRAGTPGRLITSFAQIQADPKLMQAWQMTDAQAKLGLERLMEHNLRATDNGDAQLYRKLWNRIHLEPGDPQKIDFYKQITDPAVADKLSITQIGQLRLEIDRNETPGGRSLTQMRKSADANVGNYFKTHVLFTGQGERQIAALMNWNEQVGKKVDAYVKDGKEAQVRSLFMFNTPDSVINPKYLETFVNSTPAQGLATAAATARAGAPAAPAAPAVQAAMAQPAEIDTREKLDAWFKTLPEGVTTFTGTDGKAYKVPARAPSAAPTPAAAAVADSPVTVITETGKLEQPAAAAEPQMPKLVKKMSRRAVEQAGPSWSEVAGAVKGDVTAAAKRVAGGIEAVGAAARGGLETDRRAAVRAAEALTPPSDPEKVVAAFRGFVRAGQFTPGAASTIEDAIASGLLTGPELKIARDMLAQIKGGK